MLRRMSLATRFVLLLVSAAFSVLMGIQGLTRYVTYHNQTYDLAMYARQAWGLAHGDYWDPVINAHFLASHCAFVLWPLGMLGRLFGVVPVLLVAQVLAFGLATLPLAQLAARRFGDAGALCAGAIWMAYPNISHVASYEFHPGSLAVLPLALALSAIDAARVLSFGFSCLAILLCRADFALLVIPLAVVAYLRGREHAALRRVALVAGAVSLVYLALQFLWLRPMFYVARNSYDMHFGRWGGSPFGIGKALLHEPSLVAAHFSHAARWQYPFLILWPLGLLPLCSPLWLLPAAPFVLINMISVFPTSIEMYSHYLTPAVPSLVAATFDGLARLSRLWRTHGWLGPQPIASLGLSGLLVLSALANWQLAALPWSKAFPRTALRVDARSYEAARIVAQIPEGASVQAPDPLLPHLVTRREVYRAPPPEHAVDFVVLDVSHRLRYAQREDLLRTIEEPTARRWLARRDFGLVSAEPNYLLFARGKNPRGGPAARYLGDDPLSRRGTTLTRCLGVSSAWVQPQGLLLELVVDAPCPSDLALKLVFGDQPERVDLMFDGLLSPAQLRDEQVYSWHALRPAERRALREHGLWLGVIRADGAPPEKLDPRSRWVVVIQ
jgi:uncharacterized membrane protein